VEKRPPISSLVARGPAGIGCNKANTAYGARDKCWSQEPNDMYKLIAILIAAMPIILFLHKIFFKHSKVMAEASSAFRKQVDYLVWGILFLVGCALVYSLGIFIHSVWK
jgi:hypothetical protein